MGAVTTSLAEQARSIFAELGYTVTESGSELRAERKWRVVHVTPTEPESLPESGEFRCFVTRGPAESLRRRLERANPGYEWAVISVTDEGGYEVVANPG
ncbi:MAG: hypothetical protein ABEJ89_07140 [Haloarculaceae archaeon]